MSAQISIKEPIRIEGVNVYNGRKNFAMFFPAEENEGINFFEGAKKTSANINLAKYSRRSIGLFGNYGKIELVEHLLSAVYALGIDNLDIELSDGVCPTVDNCAREYFDALKNLRVAQVARKKFWIYSGHGSCKITSSRDASPDSLEVMCADDFIINYSAGYPHKAIGEQNHRFVVSEENYSGEIADARSPAFLRNKFLAKVFLSLGISGISEENYLLVGRKQSEEYLNSENFGVRYGGDEFVRHKILDVLGTLALTGRHFKNTTFNFTKTGHKFDIGALKKLFFENKFLESE